MYTLLFFIVTIMALVILIMSQPNGRRTLFEPGVMIVALFSLCYLLPALEYFILTTDVEQWDYIDINTESVEAVSLYGLVFMISFTLFYILARKYITKYINKKKCSAKAIRITATTYLVLIMLLFIGRSIAFWMYGVRSGDYIDQYAVMASMPVLVNQLLNLSVWVLWMLIYLLLSASFSSSTRNKSLLYIWIIFLIFFVDMLLSNSRSQFVTLTIVSLAAYIFYSRPFGLQREAFFSVAFILIMGVFSLRREVQFDAASLSLSNILIPTEFNMIYRNAIHLISLSKTSNFVQPPGSSYLQALIAFIPQQFNEGKFDLATWYVKEYYSVFADAGGGLAFGIIPEAIVNFGLISMVFQALVVAVLLRVAAILADRARFLGPNVWVVFYLFCFSLTYQLIRSNSFEIISSFVRGFAIPYSLFFALNAVRIRLKPSHRI